MLRVALALTFLLLSAAPASAQNPWLQRRVLNIAHQGGEAEFPSNTMYAFEHSVKAGADMLELDVGVTKDNKVVVMHDTTLDRTTNGHGTIASHTLKQIRKLDAGYWFAGGKDPYDHRAKRHRYRGKGLKVPTLQEVIKAFPKSPKHSGKGYGHWVRLPGRHPKKDHWSKVWCSAAASSSRR